MVDLDLFPAFTLGAGLLSRRLQFIVPDYTSPALENAIRATPKPYQDDDYLDMIRESAKNQTCSTDVMGCQMLFPPPAEAMESGTAKMGAIIFGGALVDPRSYSVLARRLSDNYGFAVSIPVFDKDIAYFVTTVKLQR